MPGTRGRFTPAICRDLTFGKVETVNPGTRGSALAGSRFEASPVHAAEPRASRSTLREVSIAFLTDPWGTYIELTEGLAP